MGTVLHNRDTVNVSAAVATRSHADCGSMEDRRRKSLINVLLIKCLILTTSGIPILVDFLVYCLQLFYTNYQLDRHSVAIYLGSNRI